MSILRWIIDYILFYSILRPGEVQKLQPTHITPGKSPRLEKCF
jgi:hypothetical protein